MDDLLPLGLPLLVLLLLVVMLAMVMVNLMDHWEESSGVRNFKQSSPGQERNTVFENGFEACKLMSSAAEGEAFRDFVQQTPLCLCVSPAFSCLPMLLYHPTEVCWVPRKGIRITNFQININYTLREHL